MFDKILWKQEWKLLQNEKRNYSGWVLHREMLLKLTDDGKMFDVHLPQKEIYFEANGDFYGFANRSILNSARSIPNQFLEFEVCNCIERECKTKVLIKKLNSNEYSVEVYSKEYRRYGYYQPEQYIKEILDKDTLNKKLENITQNFEAYPFLLLPFGNCFLAD